ncbi:uncharacterized protein LOC143235765 [Tachypleus tridentatus]|uniref:uncharacterized protein LOC143235765 n=1 Tax=Tachypleus tridentatus TaxID=6853 RepID=UPI003FCF8EA0
MMEKLYRTLYLLSLLVILLFPNICNQRFLTTVSANSHTVNANTSSEVPDSRNAIHETSLHRQIVALDTATNWILLGSRILVPPLALLSAAKILRPLLSYDDFRYKYAYYLPLPPHKAKVRPHKPHQTGGAHDNVNWHSLNVSPIQPPNVKMPLLIHTGNYAKQGYGQRTYHYSASPGNIGIIPQQESTQISNVNLFPSSNSINLKSGYGQQNLQFYHNRRKKRHAVRRRHHRSRMALLQRNLGKTLPMGHFIDLLGFPF